MMTYRELHKKLVDRMDDPKDWRVADLMGRLHLKGREFWQPTDVCAGCWVPFTQGQQVHLDEVNSMVYCLKCYKKIKPRRKDGVDQSSHDTATAPKWSAARSRRR